MKLVDALNEAQLNNIKNLYNEAFPREEKKPLSVILKKRDEGLMEIFSIEDDNREFLGLAITVLYKDMVLLDYFAISPAIRTGGKGTSAFQMLKERYPGKRFFIEIENTALDVENREERIRRKKFYLKNGMTNLPFIVNLFGVEMEILSDSSHLDYNEYFALYNDTFGSEISKKIKLVSE